MMGHHRSRRGEQRCCIICHTNEGAIPTSDGPVCYRCMPQALYDRHETVTRSQIVLYTRTHEGWESCREPVEPAPAHVTVERSMAITGDGVLLAEELADRASLSESADIVVSFIHMSGLSMLIGAFRELTRHGRLRVITTAYMGATEYEALDELFRLPNTEVRMELDTSKDHIHAKAFIFHRADREGVAYVGSANISKAALTSNGEWVVKITEQEVPSVMDDLSRGYQRLWSSSRLRTVTGKDRAEIEQALENRRSRSCWNSSWSSSPRLAM